jgi:hypothetical protein
MGGGWATNAGKNKSFKASVLTEHLVVGEEDCF